MYMYFRVMTFSILKLVVVSDELLRIIFINDLHFV